MVRVICISCQVNEQCVLMHVDVVARGEGDGRDELPLTQSHTHISHEQCDNKIERLKIGGNI